MFVLRSVLAFSAVSAAYAVNIVMSNDDGWAIGNVRAAFDALTSAGNDVVLSAPATGKSGSGSLDLPAIPVLGGCQFNTCPSLAPAEGFNASNPRLNYVNSFPVTATLYGLKTLAPKFFGAAPDLVVTGPNVGGNVGFVTDFISGTLGAATAAVLVGIPAIGFSGQTGSHDDSFLTLPNAYSGVYAELTTKFVSAVVASGKPYLPSGIVLSVNFPAVDKNGGCTNPPFVLTRQTSANILGKDVHTCGNDRLPTEASVINGDGCFSSVTVLNTGKVDASAAQQAAVLKKLGSLFVCLPQ
ncbi:sure-like protein [Auricularia subglabra TFB-10046 SS5]|nr:sure-like protein [Auricularia subglabra TFB-10046 SS5]